jgi:hypothetical protein
LPSSPQSRASTRVANVCSGLPWSRMACCNSRHHVPLPNKHPSCITTSQRSFAQILDRCSPWHPHSAHAPSLDPLTFLSLASSTARSGLRGPAKVCRAQTKFSAFQQPCYCTSLKLRATGTELTKGRRHYSVPGLISLSNYAELCSHWLTSRRVPLHPNVQASSQNSSVVQRSWLLG